MSIADFITEWQAATVSANSSWIDAHLHAAGTARASGTPAPAPAPAPAPTSAAPTHSWTYPAVVKGFVARANGQRYRVRKVDSVPDVTLLRDSREYREHVFTFGEPGTGKTALVEAAFGEDLVTMLGTEDVEVGDFIGAYGPRPGGKYGWTDGALVQAMERGVPLYIDEIGTITPKVLTTVFSVMDGRDTLRITANPDRGEVTAAKGFMVVASTNPHAPGVRLSEALLSRFGLHLEIGTDYSLLRDHLDVPDAIVTAGENLEKRRQTGEISWAPQMRELLRYANQVKQRGEKIALRNLVSTAPEDDRAVVGEVLSRVAGKKITALAL
jgi:MoxR-like ATPase